MTQQFRPHRFNILPPVVKNLLIINGLFFLAALALQSAFHIDLENLLGLHYVSGSDFKPYQYLTYMFMHSTQNFSHILFNMFALWMFGNTLENVWGSKKFLIYYLITGLGAGIVYTFWIHFQLAPSINAIDSFLNNPSLNAFVEFRNSGYFSISSYDIQNHFNDFVGSYNRVVASDPNLALQKAITFMEQYRNDVMNANVVVGASGAIFGILLAFGMMFPNSLPDFRITPTTMWLTLPTLAECCLVLLLSCIGNVKENCINELFPTTLFTSAKRLLVCPQAVFSPKNGFIKPYFG